MRARIRRYKWISSCFLEVLFLIDWLRTPAFQAYVAVVAQSHTLEPKKDAIISANEDARAGEDFCSERFHCCMRSF